MRITLSECPNTSFKIRSLLKNQLEGKVIIKKTSLVRTLNMTTRVLMLNIFI